MTDKHLLTENRGDILRLAASRGAYNVRIFGSFARGTARDDSDIDILVDVEPGRSLIDVVGLWLDLQELLGRKVDLIVERAVHPHLRDAIMAEARPL